MILMSDKLFGKYDMESLEIKDRSLAQVISLKPILVPHTFGRHSRKSLGKMQVNLVERLANKLMRGGTGEKTSGKVIRTRGQMQGKKLKAIKTMEQALMIVEKEAKRNPVQVLIEAVQNSAPREDTTRVSYEQAKVSGPLFS
jgi:small subunit ribosomal protein S7